MQYKRIYLFIFFLITFIFSSLYYYLNKIQLEYNPIINNLNNRQNKINN